MRSVRSYCFHRLFFRCNNISNCCSLILPATTLAESCYDTMFSDNSSLTQAPALPATTLAERCYSYMFSNCSSLTQAPALPATTLAESCYSGMFYYCTNLTQAPALPATTLAERCYDGMFDNCTNLTQAPEIKTYTPRLNAYGLMLNMFDYNTYSWQGQLTTCVWSDLTIFEVEIMVLSENIFGYDNPGSGVRISITCKDGSGTAYYDSGNSSWVFEY